MLIFSNPNRAREVSLCFSSFYPAGSLTLYHWQRLAQPHMASMLDVRPGVMVKGFRELDRDPTVYSMDDVEDDGRVTGKEIRLGPQN